MTRTPHRTTPKGPTQAARRVCRDCGARILSAAGIRLPAALVFACEVGACVECGLNHQIVIDAGAWEGRRA